MIARLIVCDRVGTATNLHTLATVGRAVGIVETHIALATDSHTEGTVTEHLDAHRLTTRATDMLILNMLKDLSHLLHLQFTSQHHHISKLGVELQGFRIRDIQLGAQMHLLPHPAAILHHRHVAGNHGRDTRLLSCINNLTHQFQVFLVNNSIDSEIAFDTLGGTRGSYFVQIIDGERRGRMGSHVQFLDAEIDRVGPSLNGCSQRLP